jgi:uncharacterized membrane protein YhaH (DUF805 family)
MDWQSLFFSFKGRINRGKYWLAVLVFFIAGMVLALLTFVFGNGLVAQVLSFIVNLALFIAGLAVGIKRLHDRDKSAWWMLMFYVVPIVLVVIGALIGYFAATAAGTTADNAGLLFRVCVVVAVAIGVWAFVEFGCLRGTVGYNRYGPDPIVKA